MVLTATVEKTNQKQSLSSPLIKIQWIQEVVTQWIKIAFRHFLSHTQEWETDLD